MTRILIANRGEVASRLIETYQQMGMETVSVFTAAEIDSPHVEQADYSAYLTGESIEETYLNVQKILGVALDAGCDLIHPGYCFLPERTDFLAAAMVAAINVVAPDAALLERIGDRFALYDVARELGIPLIPTSRGPLELDQDPLPAAAQLGFPLVVKAVRGGVVQRVDSEAELSEAVSKVRREALRLTADPLIYLQRVVPHKFRRCGVTVVSDREGDTVHLGVSDSSIQHDYRAWVEELGDVVPPQVAEKLGKYSVALAQEMGWWGVGTVRWVVVEDGGVYLLGFSARLTTGLELPEVAYGVDLVQCQWDMAVGDPLVWLQDDVDYQKHVIQLRIIHGDPFAGGMRCAGVIGDLVLPSQGVLAQGWIRKGIDVTPLTDPLLLKLTVSGRNRQEAIEAAVLALDEIVLEGVETNLQVLKRALRDASFLRGDHHAQTLEDVLKSEL